LFVAGEVMKQCPKCQTELSIEDKTVFTTCPKCNSLLYIDKNGIEQVDTEKIWKKHLQINGLVKWACSSILGHRWSDEGYVSSSGDPYCYKLCICEICFDSKRNSNLERHTEITDYISPTSCIKRGVCTKCGHINISSYPEHDFRSYFIEGTCDNERTCQHCGLVEKLNTDHAFYDSDWVASDKTKCKSTRACRRCGQVEEAIRHSGEWVELERKYITPNGLEILFREKRVCEVCGFEESRERTWYSAYS
jgi:uncharacterized C2H2 Zn-finger protein